MKESSFGNFDNFIKNSLKFEQSSQMLCHNLKSTGKCDKQFYCQKRHFVKNSQILPNSGHARESCENSNVDAIFQNSQILKENKYIRSWRIFDIFQNKS